MLSQMPKLKQLELRVPESHIQVFESFARMIILPTVETLIVGPYCEFMIAKCPNMQTLANNIERGTAWLKASEAQKTCRGNHKSSLPLVKAAAKAPHLRHLDLIENWNAPLLRLIVETLPHLPSLAMQGRFSSMITNWISIMRRFTKLQHLAMEELGVQPSERWYFTHAEVVGRQEMYAKLVFDIFDLGSHVLKDVWMGETLRFELVGRVRTVIPEPNMLGVLSDEQIQLKRFEERRPAIGEYLRVQKESA